MEPNEKIKQADVATLGIIHYPDPRLLEVSTPIDEVDESVHRLVEKMSELMFAARGVGLAAVQTGVTVRLFITSPTPDKSDLRVYINPQIVAAEGWQENEEGCLSIPGVFCKLKRHSIVTIEALNLHGERFTQTGEALAARAIQHEMDHLDGRLIIHRMGSVARLANRRTLKDLEARFEESAR